MQQPVARIKSLPQSLNCDGARGWTLLALTALLLASASGGESWLQALRYDRAAILHGEIWRFLTGHFVHLNLAHAALNALGLALLWMLFRGDYSPGQWLAIVLASIAAIDAGLWLADPGLSWYVGLSGVLHGIMAAGALAHMRRRQLDGWMLGMFLAGKLLYEQRSGALPWSASALPVVVDAHLYGAMGGFAAALIIAGLPRNS